MYTSTQHDEALQMYFSYWLMPKVISRKLRLSLKSIYKNIYQFKNFIQKLSCGEIYTLKLKIEWFIVDQTYVMKIAKNMANKWFTVSKINWMLNKDKAQNEKS